MATDREKNRFSARAKRYANVGTKVGGVAARMAGQRFLGVKRDRATNAIGLAAAIPAVVLYNNFVARIKKEETEINNFHTDFLNIVKRNFFVS